MTKLMSIALMALLAVFVLSACSSPSGPELIVRACIDALNARDKDRFFSLWSPGQREFASKVYEFHATFDVKYPTVKRVVVQGLGTTGELKNATVEVVEESSMGGKQDKTLKIGLEQQEGKWYVFTFAR